MGSRFGGVKQLTPVGPHGEVILDYSARDAFAVGFERVVIVTRSDIEEELTDHVQHWPASVRPVIVCQDRDPLARDAERAGRRTPLGTVHAAVTGMRASEGS